MTVGSVAAWLVASALAPPTAVATLLGMAAPLAVTTSTLWLIERAYRRDPRSVTPLMIKAFGAKLVFFGGYVGVMLGVLSVPATPFVVSFTAYLIGLYLIEALCLSRLFIGDAGATDSGTGS
jgi:hypothetical protein